MGRALKTCAQPGCPELVASGRCTECARQVDAQRGRRQARGYDAQHDRLRKQWIPKVEAGRVDCHAPTCVMPVRRILAGQPWDLGHTDDRRSWRGPEHAPCNRGWRRTVPHRA